MQIDVKSSLCSPKGCPATFEVDPTAVGLEAKGAPRADASPIALDLPTVQVNDLKVVVNPPNVRLDVSGEYGGILLGILGLGIAQAADAIGDLVAEATGGEADAEMKPVAELVLTRGEVAVTGSVSFGSMALRGMPTGGEVAPMSLQLDADDLTIEGFARGLTARLLGCLMLNGGDCGCCEEKSEPGHSEQPPGTVVAPTIFGRRAKAGPPFELFGQQLGPDAGRVIVLDADNDERPVAVESWSDTVVVVRQVEQLAPGTHTIQLVTSDGRFSNVATLTVV